MADAFDQKAERRLLFFRQKELLAERLSSEEEGEFLDLWDAELEFLGLTPPREVARRRERLAQSLADARAARSPVLGDTTGPREDTPLPPPRDSSESATRAPRKREASADSANSLSAIRRTEFRQPGPPTRAPPADGPAESSIPFLPLPARTSRSRRRSRGRSRTPKRRRWGTRNARAPSSSSSSTSSRSSSSPDPREERRKQRGAQPPTQTQAGDFSVPAWAVLPQSALSPPVDPSAAWGGVDPTGWYAAGAAAWAEQQQRQLLLELCQ
eukprot:Hpha_TRINITY_DN10253_c0_g1::TRINITY_DN10253_c0_g1_i2::g.35078::m.35078